MGFKGGGGLPHSPNATLLEKTVTLLAVNIQDQVHRSPQLEIVRKEGKQCRESNIIGKCKHNEVHSLYVHEHTYAVPVMTGEGF